MEDLGYIVSRALSKKRIKHPLETEVKELTDHKTVKVSGNRRVHMRRHSDGSIDMEIPPHAVRKLDDEAKEETLKQVRAHPQFDPKWLGESS